MNIRAYRLLRNNKEQGPFTAEELIKKNLKPFDLIWIDGRSAAWSYPGELAEFKMYVPFADEENINLRINKEASSSISASVQAAIVINNNIAEAAIKQKPRYKVSAAWSKIQTIPAPAFSNALVAEPKKAVLKKITEATQPANLQSRSLSWEEAWLDWEKEKVSDIPNAEKTNRKPASVLQTKAVNKNYAVPVLETKFEEPLDAIKDRYIENILLQKQRSKKRFSFGKASEFVVPCVALIIIFSIGYWLLHNTNATASALRSSPVKSVPTAAVNSKNEPAANMNDNTITNTASIIADSEKQNIIATNEPVITEQAAERKTNDAHIVKPTVKQVVNIKESNHFIATQIRLPDLKSNAQKTVDNISKTDDQNNITSATANAVNASGSKPVRGNTKINDESANQSSQKNDIPAAKSFHSKSSIDYVHVPEYIEMNNGSANLKIENISDVNLDLIVVDVQYYDASGGFRKGETLYLHNLKAGKNVIVKTPKDINSLYATSKVSLVSSDANNVYVIGDN